MKLYLSVFVTFLVSSLLGQYDQTSFYFSLETIDFSQPFDGFVDKETGFYDISAENRRHLMVNKDSIGVRSGFEIILPKSKALAKGFSFKDGKMYGMEPYNGIHYKEFNDSIFALYYQYDHYFSPTLADKIISGDDGYFVFLPEKNGFYTCEYITFEKDQISIYSIDHTLVMNKLLKLSNIYRKELNGAVTFIAQPTVKELEQLVKKECFNDQRSYDKTEHL